MGDRVAVQNAVDAWYALANSQWDKLRKDSAAKPKSTVWYRAKSFKWLLALARMLYLHGVDIEDYRQPADPIARPPPQSWPTLVVNLDQGGDGWSAVHYLGCTPHYCLAWMTDPSHRIWIDVQLPLHDSGVWAIDILLVAVHIVAHGPWCDARWFQSWREAGVSYDDHVHPN